MSVSCHPEQSTARNPPTPRRNAKYVAIRHGCLRSRHRRKDHRSVYTADTEGCFSGTGRPVLAARDNGIILLCFFLFLLPQDNRRVYSRQIRVWSGVCFFLSRRCHALPVSMSASLFFRPAFPELTKRRARCSITNNEGMPKNCTQSV